MSDVLERVRATGLVGGPVVVLFSGGRDSVCLLDVCVELAAVARALHVNYGLRDDADDDEAFCRALCERLGVALTVRRARRPEGNLQAWAREVRYAEAARFGTDVAVGHTASDQAETVLYRLAASPGRRALLGMAARSGRVVRPLLAAGLTREETAAWCRARGLGWREDASNDSPRYARNRVRAGLLPALRAIHPAAEANVVGSAALLRDEAAVLDEVVSAALDGDGVDRARLAALPGALARLVLVRLAEDAAGALVPTAAERLGDVLAAPDGAAVAVQGGVELVVAGGRVTARAASPVSPAAPEPVALAVPGEARFGAWTVTARRAAGEPRAGVVAAAGPFTVRARRPGDRMAPLGMRGHTKSLQDLFVDRRVPRAERATLPVVECDGEVAWIPGVATSERFRVEPGTGAAVALEAHQSII
jgi:tRNA(Ile)-lysidine synthase